MYGEDRGHVIYVICYLMQVITATCMLDASQLAYGISTVKKTP